MTIYDQNPEHWDAIAKFRPNLAAMAKLFTDPKSFNEALGYTDAAKNWTGKRRGMPSPEAERRATEWVAKREIRETWDGAEHYWTQADGIALTTNLDVLKKYNKLWANSPEPDLEPETPPVVAPPTLRMFLIVAAPKAGEQIERMARLLGGAVEEIDWR